VADGGHSATSNLGKFPSEMRAFAGSGRLWRMRWIVCIAICLATVDCSVSTQSKSVRTVAAFEVPLPSEADRGQFLAILRIAAAAQGMHVDIESKQGSSPT